MRTIVHSGLLFALLAITGVFSFCDVVSQTGNTNGIIHFPLQKDDISLYDFADVRFEYDKTEALPFDLGRRDFRPLKKVFQRDSLFFSDSMQTVWFKFYIRNDIAADTSVTLRFPGSVNKAVLYKKVGDTIEFVGRTGWAIAVIARTSTDEWGRIDIPLKAESQSSYFLQIPRIGFRFMLNRTPVLASNAYADLEAYKRERRINRPALLWSHLFTGIFFMFFVFGFIKYLVFGKDRSYLYFALLGLANLLLTLTQSEYPAMELPWFENLRGIELFNLVNGVAILMQGLFVIEILQLKIKYPKITLAVKGFLFSQLLISILYTIDWVTGMQYHPEFWSVNTFVQFLLVLMMLVWIWYLAKMRKGFYKFIFLGAVTILIASALLFVVRFFNLYHLLPGWFGADQRGSVNHFMQIALVVDMCFYFAGLAYRDRQVEYDKILFQEQLIKQLEANQRFQEDFTMKLEEQVSEKTAELLKQRHELETEKEAKLLADFNRKISESELKALRSQMNPHFVFNILNTIESYALENNKEAVSNMIHKFSTLTRLVLENSMNTLVPFENDWKSLKLYVELEQLRCIDKFKIGYEVQQQLLTPGFLIPPLIIQPFIENAILHGLRNKAGNRGELILSASLKNGYIIVRVQDNGIGRANAALLKANNPIHKTSLGIKVTQDRISMFNNLNRGKKAKVEIHDLHEGTLALIWLPATTNMNT